MSFQVSFDSNIYIIAKIDLASMKNKVRVHFLATSTKTMFNCN
jgi:hypothetical protein